MKKLKKLLDVKKLGFIFTLGFTALAAIMPELAMAENNPLEDFFNSPKVETIIILAFGIVVFWRLMKIILEFDPKSLPQELLTVAFLVFLMFNWQTVLGWIGLG